MSVRLVASSALSFSPWLLDFYLGIEVYKSADSIHSFRHSAYIRCGFITMIDHFPHFVRPFHTTYLPFFTSVKPYIAKTFRLEWQKTSRTVVWHSGFHQNFVLGGGGGLEKFLVPKFSIIFPFMRNINIRWVKKKRLRFVVERDFRLISSFFSINVTEERTVPRLSLPPFSKIDMYFDINNSITIF